MSATYSALLWCDLESTGSDRQRDFLMEAAFIATTMELDVLWQYEAVIPWDTRMQARLDALPIVADMHEHNGLIEDCKDTEGHVSHALQDIDRRVRVLMLETENVKKQEWLLAGSGVSHFDREYIKRDFPMVETMLAYPNFDIGVSRRVLNILGARQLLVDVPESSEQDKKAHRAMADACAHLEETRQQRARFREVCQVLTAFDM